MDFLNDTTTIKKEPDLQSPYLADDKSSHPSKVKYLNETTNIKIEPKVENINERNLNIVRKPTILPQSYNNNNNNNNIEIKKHIVNSPRIICTSNGTPINIVKISQPSPRQPYSRQVTPSYTNIVPINITPNGGIKRAASISICNSPSLKIQRVDLKPQSPQIANIDQRFNYAINNFRDSFKTANDYKFDESEYGELKYNDAYSNYQPAKIKFGKPHPYVVVESRSLSTEEAPPVRYELKLPSKIIDRGILSNVQIEAVIYACQKHEEYLTDGRRAGFLIGDGAGVGKGRTVAGIIYENFLNGRKKAIWVSVANDLEEDAKRDLEDIGDPINIGINVRSLNKMSYIKIESKENGKFNEGVLFVTYSSLISNCKKMAKKCFKTRFDQIVKWFGKDYDGVIILDECHKAKNLNKSNKTKTGTMVKRLQDTLKQARIVYASATMASEPKHMAYMVRLGLWGPGKPFKKFSDFEISLTKNGVSAMELVAIEMKRKGMYLARQLSFENVTFEIRETKIENSTINGHKFKDVYDKCVQLWSRVYLEFKNAFKRNKDNFERSDNSFEAHFWSAHQRFFKYLCIAAKVDECVKIATEEMANKKCIVIGLQTTGESSIVDSLEDNCGETSEFVSNAKGVIKNLIKNHYPSIRNLKKIQEAKDSKLILKPAELKKLCGNFKSTGNTKKSSKDWNSESEDSESSSTYSDTDDEYENDSKPNRIAKTEIIEYEHEIVDDADIFSEDYLNQQQMLKEVDEMDSMFPINALDQLIHELGGPGYVAELTGRKGRMVEVDGKISYQSRKEGDVGLDQINLKEKERFNNLDKLVAIISDAASTGISLHSDMRCRNQLQRFHITLELPWSADKATQQFGRTHRSNQVMPPHYMFLISDLPGERRFASTVAKRLESLGALTNGDRRCADTRDLSQFNLDNGFGFKAAKDLVNTIINHYKPEIAFPIAYMKKFDNDDNKFKKAATKALIDVGLDSHKTVTVTKFLNRILGIELDMQNALFQYFLDIMNVESNNAKSCNRFDHGIRDMVSDQDTIIANDPEIIKLNENNDNDCLKIHKINKIFEGVSWTTAQSIYFRNTSENMFCTSINHVSKILALAEHEHGDQFRLITANYPVKIIDRKQLNQSYEKYDYDLARNRWEFLFQNSLQKCIHSIIGKVCHCTEGKRTKIYYIITGDLISVWKKISTYKDEKMDIVRVHFSDETKLVGALISPRWHKNICEALIGTSNTDAVN